MKKFILGLLVVVSMIFTANAEAAYIYIPNFRDLVSNKYELHIEFLGMDQKSSNGVNYTCWKYNVVDGKTGEYLDRYINKCTSNRYSFRLIERNSNEAILSYHGRQAKFVQSFKGGFHMYIERSGSRVNINVVGGMYPDP